MSNRTESYIKDAAGAAFNILSTRDKTVPTENLENYKPQTRLLTLYRFWGEKFMQYIW